MWVATFSVTAVRVGPVRGRSGWNSLAVPTRTGPRRHAGRPAAGRALPLGGLAKPMLTSVNYHASVWRRTALTKVGTETYPLRHLGNHVSIFTCMDVYTLVVQQCAGVVAPWFVRGCPGSSVPVVRLVRSARTCQFRTGRLGRLSAPSAA